MNKGELIEAVAAELGGSRAQAAKAVEAIIGCITEGVKRDDNVTIVGFGTFQKKKRAPRTVRNPATKELMNVDASTTVSFKPSKVLKESV